jgi:hypothetical protein
VNSTSTLTSEAENLVAVGHGYWVSIALGSVLIMV